MSFPNLAIMRGHQCKVVWYDNDFSTKIDQKNIKSEAETNIPLNTQEEELSEPNAQVINKQISGQYLIDAVVIRYDMGNWKQTLTLIRPQDKQNKVKNNYNLHNHLKKGGVAIRKLIANAYTNSINAIGAASPVRTLVLIILV